MRWIAGLCLMLACDPRVTVDDADAEGEDDAADEAGLAHGFLKLGFVRDENTDENPFGGTTQVVVEFLYGECLIDFYEKNTRLRQDGVDGALVFGGRENGGEGWLDRLCVGDNDFLSCEISIAQQLDVGEPKLTLVYEASVEQDSQQLRAGPFPTSETAQCADAEPATVNLQTGTVKGFDEEGQEVWRASSVAPNEASAGDERRLTVYVYRAD